jgi:hypothetical protein
MHSASLNYIASQIIKTGPMNSKEYAIASHAGVRFIIYKNK